MDCPDCSVHPKGLCLRHKLQRWREQGGLHVSPQATPTRRNHVAPKVNENANAWERGIARDDRGMPYLKPDLEPYGLKEFQSVRSKFESRNRLTTTSGQKGSEG